MKRGLPILWVAYNNKMTDDALQLLLNSALSVAKRYRGQLTFVQLDVDAQPQIAQNFGFEVSDKMRDEDDDEDEDEDRDEEEEEEGSPRKLPQVFIMNQIAQIKEGVDMDDIEGTVQKVINEYMLQVRISRGQGMPDMMDDAEMEYDDDDDEFEEDDDDEDEEMDSEYQPNAGQSEDEEGSDEGESEGAESDEPKADL